MPVPGWHSARLSRLPSWRHSHVLHKRHNKQYSTKMPKSTTFRTSQVKVNVFIKFVRVVGEWQFYPRHFSISQVHGGGTYLLSVTGLPKSPSKDGNYHFIVTRSWTAWLADLCPGRDLNLTIISDKKHFDLEESQPNTEGGFISLYPDLDYQA